MYLVLEYAEGGDLETAIQKASGPFSESRVMFWCDPRVKDGFRHRSRQNSFSSKHRGRGRAGAACPRNGTSVPAGHRSAISLFAYF